MKGGDHEVLLNRYFEIADGPRKLVVLLLEIYRIHGHGT